MHLTLINPASLGQWTPGLYKSRFKKNCFPPLAAAANSDNLLSWIAEQPDIHVFPDLSRSYLGPELGYGLINTASTDIPPNTPLLSLPFSFVLTSEGCPDESTWSVYMACKLLHEVSLQDASSKLPWLQQLPTFVDLPWLYWTEEEIDQLQDIDTIEEAIRLGQIFAQACQTYDGTWSPEQLAWALSLIHSRTFIDRNNHILVPGIDMCNHSLTPTAKVRTVYSPDTCQGAAATEEIAPPRSEGGDTEGSRFELVTGDDGLAPNEEVTISYGNWPNDVLLLFYGWVDDENPHDAAVLFADLFELESFHARLVDTEQVVEEGLEQAPVSSLLADSLQLEPWQYQRMVVTSNGLDGRLLEAANAILQAKPIRNTKTGLPFNLPEYLNHRCKELLAGYPTTLSEDRALLKELEQGGDEEEEFYSGVTRKNLKTAVRYRLAKKRMLHGMLSQLGG